LLSNSNDLLNEVVILENLAKTRKFAEVVIESLRARIPLRVAACSLSCNLIRRRTLCLAWWPADGTAKILCLIYLIMKMTCMVKCRWETVPLAIIRHVDYENPVFFGSRQILLM
jgi:hypothetical protein